MTSSQINTYPDEDICMVCRDDLDKLNHESFYIVPGCGHHHCTDCLQQGFEYAAETPGAWPFKCCAPGTQIPIEALTSRRPEFELGNPESPDYLDGLVDLYYLMGKQVSSKHPFFCPVPDCGRFIPDFVNEDQQDRSIIFKRCGVWLCKLCKKVAHNGECAVDEDREDLRTLAEAEGWMECECGHIVSWDSEGCSVVQCGSYPKYLCFKCRSQADQCQCSLER